MVNRQNYALIDSDSSSGSISDLDRELLKLARKRSQPSNIYSSDSDSSSDGSEQKCKKPKRISASSKSEPKPKREPKKSKKQAREEGEVLDPASFDEEYNDGYDDQLMGDEDDRARLAIVTEMERETEIFKRIELREMMKTRFEIKKKLKQAQKAERTEDKSTRHKEKNREKDSDISDHSKLQTDFSSIDHKERSKERKKNIEENRRGVDKRVNAMTKLKARREGKRKREKAEEKRKEELRKKENLSTNKCSVKRLKTSNICSDDDSSASEGGKSSPPPPPPPPQRESLVSSTRFRSRSSSSFNSGDYEQDDKVKKTAFIPTNVDMNLIRLSRHKLEQLVHVPFFNRIAKGCFVKIGIGQHNNMSVYHVAEIIDVFETPKIYVLGNTKTNKGLRVRYGNQDRVFRLEFVSNQEFTEAEYHKWIEASAAAGNSLPGKEQVEQKQADIEEALNYEFSEQDIGRIIREKERFKSNPHNYAIKKTLLMEERDSALRRGDNDVARELGQKLSDLEERASELDKMRTSTISSISSINDRNRKRNIEEAEKSIIAELKANKGKKNYDPFTRRNFRAAPKEEMEEVEEKKVAVVPVQPVRVTQDEVFSAHDFDIKINLDVPLPVASVNVTPKIASKDATPKRVLNLQDYKRKRGLI